MWRRFIKDYFSFSSADRNGLVVLSVIIILIIVLTYTVPLIPSGNEAPDFSGFQDKISQLYKVDPKEIEKIPLKEPDFFYFDPNNLDRQQMERLGFDNRLIRTFENYLKKGGKFRNATDLMKIYGMTDSLYMLIEPFVRMKTEVPVYKTGEISKPENPVIVKVELNTADTVLLKSLKGIGSVLSARIVRYRELLGGFYHVDQIKEVYGITEEIFLQVYPFLTIEKTELKKMDINQVTFNELLRHPYISYEQALNISRFIQKNKKIHAVDILLEEGILDSLTYKKINPYLIPKIEQK